MEYSFGDTVLKAENVSLKLKDKDNNEKLILRDINLDIKEINIPGKVTGQIVGLLGPSGRGKTQLFKLLAGINKPTTGTVWLGDQEKGGAKPVKVGDVGVVYQNYPLFEYMDVTSNLRKAFHNGESESEKKDKMNFYLDRFGLTEHKEKYPAQLSGGQRQRIAIIQQILCSEHYILLDEPFSGLDPLMLGEVCNLLKEIASLDELNTIVVISHDIFSILSISSIVWILGNDYEEMDGKKVAKPGARIKYIENILDKGFFGDPHMITNPSFTSYIASVRKIYNDL